MVDNGNIPTLIKLLRECGVQKKTIAAMWNVSVSTLDRHSQPRRIRIDLAKQFSAAWTDMAALARICKRFDLSL
jgi:hypothetical protein